IGDQARFPVIANSRSLPSRRQWLISAGVFLPLAAVLLLVRPSPEAPVSRLTIPTEAAPMCPWREPEADMRAFFPGANRRRTETRILSAKHLELARRLGRAPTSEEHAAYLHRIYRGDTLLGTVLIRRV